MGADTIQPDGEWLKRSTAARKELDDMTVVAHYQRIIDRCDPAAAPSAHIFNWPAAARHTRRVCLLAGSFNPLTRAHIALEEAARKAAQLDVIIWTCTAITVDKERVARASLPDRLGQLSAYVKNAAAPEGNVLALLNRGLYVDQASAIRPHLGPGVELYILIGFDKIVQIFDPRYYTDREAALRALFAQAKLLVAPRAGAGAGELEALLARPENTPYAGHVRFIHMSPEYAEESSTEARALAARLDPTSDEALRQVATPEGMALIATGAYAPVTTTDHHVTPDVDDTSDAYLWRQTWIRASARIESPLSWRDVPPLSALLAHTLAHDERGAESRHALIRALTAPAKDAGRLLGVAVATAR